ncbi:hypothetical protein FKP32DRAFT_1596502 [Trametes sanguinea]|nr:hypothetical protein FKP32DRAFT_1596502 [Trametes sanguinea]
MGPVALGPSEYNPAGIRGASSHQHRSSTALALIPPQITGDMGAHEHPPPDAQKPATPSKRHVPQSIPIIIRPLWKQPCRLLLQPCARTFTP